MYVPNELIKDGFVEHVVKPQPRTTQSNLPIYTTLSSESVVKFQTSHSRL